MTTKYLLAHSKNFWLPVFWTFLILFLCFKSPSGESKFYFPNADKVAHFTFYFVFVLLWFRSILFYVGNKFFNKILLLVISICFGLAIELAQNYFTTSRKGDVWDVLANTIGSLMGLFFASFLFKKPRFGIDFKK
ncbi:VanZ family protein [Flavobacterium sp.]|uniref:VanZ family protein n=1 Tax=Flavobacterium sp. TaxID=239 RepID=UPI00286DC5A5|nr:VanZ family protein [Flavobacterium sp.]